MATALLDVIVEAARSNPGERVYIPHTAATDIESFCWVIMYVVYRRTIDGSGLQAEDSTAHAEMKREFARLFSALNPGKLAQERQRLLKVGRVAAANGMRNLLRYMERECQPLAALLLAVWKVLRECADFDTGTEDLPAWRVEAIQAAFEAENKERQKRGLPLARYNPEPEEPIVFHGSLIVNIERMLEQLNVAPSVDREDAEWTT